MSRHATIEIEGLASARRRAHKLGLARQTRQILLCCDVGRAKCAPRHAMKASWKFLKKRCKELGLHRRGGVLRTKASCLEICKAGPIAVIYPDNVWYGGCSPEVLEEILQQHVLGGNIVEAYRLAGRGDATEASGR